MTLPQNQPPPLFANQAFMGSGTITGGIDSMMPMLTNSIITITGMRDGNIINAIIGIIFLTLFNKIMAAIPLVITFIHTKATNYFNKSRMNTYASIALSSLSEKKPTGTIVYEKIKDNQENIVVTALINYISSLDTCKFLIFNCDYYVGNNEEFQLKPDVMCRVLKYTKDDKGKICEYIFEIFSYVYDTEYLKNFVAGIVREYNAEKTNNLGKQSYYFNEIYEQIPKSMDGTYRFEMARKNLSFDMVPFHTNKSLRNVFGEHLSIIKKRVDTFINNPRWYEEKGIPYTLGIMLSGPPGTGKTSLIKAVAKDTRRHIFNISLRQTTTQTQLKNLFYNPEIHVLRNGSNEIVNIPLDKRLYVIEDIDCLTDIVISRTYKKTENTPILFTTQSGTVNTGILAQSDVPAFSRPHLVGLKLSENGNQESSITPPKESTTQISEIKRRRFLSPIKTGRHVIKLNPGEHIEFDSNEPYAIEPIGLSKLMEEEVSELYGLSSVGGQCNSEMNMSMYGNSAARSLDEMFNTNLSGQYNFVPSANINNHHPQEKINSNQSNGDTITEHHNNNGQNQSKKNNSNSKNDPHPEQLNLSFLLNLLDGVLETPGRILIITTNHPERLDKALIRPGRVDIHLQVGNCSQDMIVDILRFFYNNQMINISDWKYEKAITPAEVNKIILNNFDNPTAAIAEICAKTSNQWTNDNLADQICGE